MTAKTPLPPEVLDHHTAVVGKTGAGKTSTEKLLVEQAVNAGYRVCILDTIKSDWWGITSSADGKKPGLPFRILGGPHGHVPLHSSAGGVIGQLVATGKLPLSIIDMADFEPGGLQRFFVDFAPALMRHAKGVVYLVIEEAHEVAPKERSGISAENMAIHWAKKLATAGRSKGIRLVVATQRIQSLHNAVLGSCETMITHRLTTPADQAPVMKWLEANTDKATEQAVAKSLSSLPTGTAWVCSGEARIFKKMALPKFQTYDNTATPTGDGAEVRVKTAAVDQDELRELIGEAVAEAEANDPKRLKAKIAELERQIIGGNVTDSVHNHHNYAWREKHGERDLWVVRKGATPAFPGQRGFVGGSMGDDAVIIEGVESKDSAESLYSTVHGAGRLFGRKEAKRRFGREEMDEWLQRRGVLLFGADLDESPMAYRRLDEVLGFHSETVRIQHRLRPVVVVMAGAGEVDPFKD